MGFTRDNIIVIDDGSRDTTGKIARQFGVCVLHHRKNLGKGAALKNGLNTARSKNLDSVFTLDADGQHLVSEMPKFMKCNGQPDLIVGLRKDTKKMPVLRVMTNRITSLVISILAKLRLPDVQCGFRYLNLDLLDKVVLKTNHYQIESEMVLKAVRNGYRVRFLPVATVYRNERSYIRPLIDTLRFVAMAVRFLWD
jgi:glycosyltransferase involved in cell wall biosynthesis